MKRSEMLKALRGSFRSLNADQLRSYQDGDLSLGKLCEHLSDTALDCVEFYGEECLFWDEEDE